MSASTPPPSGQGPDSPAPSRLSAGFLLLLFGTLLGIVALMVSFARM